MAGKSKQQKKVRAKAKKRLHEELNQKGKPKKVVIDQPKEELGNNAEPLPKTADNTNEDDERIIPMETLEANVARMEAETPLPTNEQITSYERQKREDAGEPEPEEQPFDPKSVVANILKKKDGA